MEPIAFIAALATLVGIVASIVQIIEYVQKRRAARHKRKESAAQVESPPATPADLVPSVSRRKTPHNLPQPDYGRFVGRDKDLIKLRQLLRPYPHGVHSVITVGGIGGIGKSALALETAHRYLREYEILPSDERFETIVWFSAKETVLTANGIRPRQQSHRTLADLYTTISVTLDREDITRAQTEEEQDALVRRALARQRTLLVLDNLESVDDDRLMAFLREPPAPTKIIVTTRHWVEVAYPLRLEAMKQQDALGLIAQECENKGVELSAEGAEWLYRRTGGIPLAIVWSIGQMAFGLGTEAVFRRLGNPQGDFMTFVFKGSVELVRGSDAHRLLMALALFVTDASREALGCVTGLDEDMLSRDEGLEALEKLSLIGRQTGGRFSLLPLTKTYALAELKQAPAFKHKAYGRLVDHFLTLTAKVVQEKLDMDPTLGRLVEADIENILAVIQHCYDHDLVKTYLTLTKAIWFFLYTRGRWAEMASLLEQALTASRDPLEQAFFLNQLAWIPILQGNTVQATKRLDQVENLLSDIPGNEAAREIIELNDGLGRVSLTLSCYSEAESFFERSLQIAEKYKSRYTRRIIVCKYGLAAPAFMQGEVRKADVLLAESESLAKQLHSLRSLIYILGRQGEFARLQGRFSVAEQKLEESIKWATECREKRGLAQASLSLALVREAQGKVPQALKLSQTAADLFQRLGMIKQAAEAKALSDRLQEKDG